MMGSQSFNGATCNTSSNYCSLQVTGSQLSVTGLFIVSVVATNAVGSGNSTVFPTQSKCFTETVLHSLSVMYIIQFLQTLGQLLMCSLMCLKQQSHALYYRLIGRVQTECVPSHMVHPLTTVA